MSSLSRLDRPDLPYALQIELTSRCNLRCRMCPLTTGTSSSAAEPGPMTDAVFEDVMAMARKCRQVVIAGYGEPLADSRCMPLLCALDAEGIKTRLSTNGIGLTPKIAKELTDLSNLIQINVSVDTPDPDAYREVRGGKVHRAFDGLANLMAAVDTPARVTVSCVAMRSTLSTLSELPAMLGELGVRRLVVQGVLDYNEFAASERTPYDFTALAAACSRHHIDLELPTGVPDAGVPWDETRTRQCMVPWDMPFVDKHGRVFPCCYAAAVNTGQIGQIGETSLERIWVDLPLAKFRRDILDGRTTPAVCRSCAVVPLGEHPLQRWAATIIEHRVVIDDTGVSIALVSRNDGTQTWGPEHTVRVGTSAPRDWGSPVAHASWLSDNRAVSFSESHVPPGELATFSFPVTPTRNPVVAELQLVADGVCWLPNTRFAVRLPAARRSWKSRLRRWLTT